MFTFYVKSVVKYFTLDMGVGSILGVFVIVSVAVTLTVFIRKVTEEYEAPQLENTWWGPGKPQKETDSIQEFKIKVSNQTLDDLNYRLKNRRHSSPSLEGVAQEYGIHSDLLEEIVDFWINEYDWREREKFLNQYLQFKVSVQGLKIHYLHIKPVNLIKDVKVYPLLLLHGWSSSVREFYEVIPKLTTPQKGRNFIFELIVPSLPGFGFSDAAARPGLGGAQMAVIFKNFMQKLGYEKYFVQGGDWGGIIARYIATLFPEKVIGFHSTFFLFNTPMSTLQLLFYSIYPPLGISKEHEHKVYPISSVLSFYMEETGYLHIQSTKPDTIGFALNDSPVGLVAYLLEKYTTYTNRNWKSRVDGGLKEKYSYTDLLDNIMIYWLGGSITTSMRLYAESFNKAQFNLNLDRVPVFVPSGCTRYSNELVYPLDAVLKYKFKNLVHLADLEGGHFAALEVPNLFANDILDFAEKTISFLK